MNMDWMNKPIDDFLLRSAERADCTALMSKVRLRAILRDDRERTRPRWTFAGVHPSGKLRAYYCWVPLCDMPRVGV